jgi:hypothetical protein
MRKVDAADGADERKREQRGHHHIGLQRMRRRKGHGQSNQQGRSHQDYAVFHGERLDGCNALRIVRSY